MARKKTAAPAPGVLKELTVSRPALLEGGSDMAFRQFIHDTLAFSARVQEVRARLGGLIGMSGGQYTILIAIGHLQTQPGGVGVNLVAEHLHLSGAFVTIEVNKLVAAGLVEKVTNPDDRRRVLLTLSDKATALLNELTRIQRPVNNALFECLSPAQFRAMRQIMAELVGCADRSLRLLDFLRQEAEAAGTVPGRAAAEG